MKYSVIHSNDPYLLARMATDLQMSDEKFFVGWFDPFVDDRQNMFIDLDYEIGFYKVDDKNCPNIHELTESNYLQVLEAVLS